VTEKEDDIIFLCRYRVVQNTNCMQRTMLTVLADYLVQNFASTGYHVFCMKGIKPVKIKK